jgi:hypothetical protein
VGGSRWVDRKSFKLKKKPGGGQGENKVAKKELR